MKTLKDKVVLITGGAQGIGFETAKRFASEGSAVAITDLRDENAAAALQALKAQGARAFFYKADVCDTERMRAACDAVERELGPVDVLVNNAGVVFGGAFRDLPLEKHLLTYRINTMAPVALTHIMLPKLMKRPESHIVNMASASGFVGLPFGSTYASSKWAVIGFSESLRLELKKTGAANVHVTAVCPGYVGTGMFRGVGKVLLTPELTPTHVAKLIIRAVKNNRPYVRAPFMIKTIPLLKGTLPRGAVDFLLEFFRVTTSMQSWKGKY